jgi:hypothetical protein
LIFKKKKCGILLIGFCWKSSQRKNRLEKAVVQKVLAGLKPLVIMNHTSFSAKCRWVFRSINNKLVISFNYITIAYFPQFTQSTPGICRLNLGNAIATFTPTTQGGAR